MSFRLAFWYFLYNFLILISSVIQVLLPLFLQCRSPCLFFLSSFIAFSFIGHLFPFSDFFQPLSLHFCLNMKSNCYVVRRTQLRDRIDSPLSKVLCSRILCSETSSVRPLFLFTIHCFSLSSICIFDVELGGDCENKSSYVKCNSLTPCFNV